MADEEKVRVENKRDAQDEDEDLAIFQAIESSRNQIHEGEMRMQRENVVAHRGMQAHHQQAWQQQQPHKDAQKPSKPAVYAPKGIPTSMIVTQPQPEEGVPCTV